MPINNITRDDHLRAGLYLSVPKLTGRSLDKQRHWCRTAAAMHGVEITTEYVDAPAHPMRFELGLRRAIDDLCNGTIGALVCTDASRLTRDPKLLYWLLQQIASARGWLLFAGPLMLSSVVSTHGVVPPAIADSCQSDLNQTHADRNEASDW